MKTKNYLILIILTGLILGSLLILSLLTYFNQPSKNISAEHTPSLPAKQNENTVNTETPKLDTAAQSILPGSRLIALYGSPGIPALGVLGEQPIDQSVKRIMDLSSQYQQYSTEKIIPTFEIITTVASAGPTQNGDYSSEIDISTLKPWVEIAKQNNIYVILDLQPGLADFTSQAKLYEELLSQPNVGLALDPEWRLKPGQKHMKSIGSVSADEINATANWLNALCIRNNLPKKLFLIHQFKLSMIENQEKLSPTQQNLNWLIQMDGLGAQATKLQTWHTILDKVPDNVNVGWKNFIDEDKPMLTPEQTMQLKPKPYYVSYQ